MTFKELIDILSQDEYKDRLDEEANVKIDYMTSDLTFGEFDLEVMGVYEDNDKLQLNTESISIEVEELNIRWGVYAIT